MEIADVRIDVYNRRIRISYVLPCYPIRFHVYCVIMNARPRFAQEGETVIEGPLLPERAARECGFRSCSCTNRSETQLAARRTCHAISRETVRSRSRELITTRI